MPRSSEPTTPPSPPRYRRLDALRGVAILGVILFHAYIIRPFHGPWWMNFVGQGAEGVGLFYMVSALTLALSWQHRRSRDRSPRRAFWARRFFRIAPLFYLTLLLVWLAGSGNPTVVPPSMRHHIFTWPNLIAHLTFGFGWLPWFQNSWIGVEWSIGVEMTFYFLFPWLIEQVVPPAKPWSLLTAGVASALAWPWLLHHLWFSWPRWAKSFAVFSFPEQMIWFAAGFSVFTMRARPNWKGWGVLWFLGGIALGVHAWSPLTANLVWVLPNLGLLWLAWHDHPGVRWLTRNRVIQYVGTRSYSLYLLHWLILAQIANMSWASQPTTIDWTMRVLAGLAVSLVAAEIAYRWIERPGIALGRELIKRQGWGSRADPRSRPAPAAQNRPAYVRSMAGRGSHR